MNKQKGLSVLETNCATFLVCTCEDVGMWVKEGLDIVFRMFV